MKTTAISILVLILVGCAGSPKVKQSNLEIQAYQTKEFETQKRTAFDATLSVLQDSGFIIDSADFETGFVTGTGTKNSDFNLFYGNVNRQTKMSAFIEQFSDVISKVRINIIQSAQRKSGWNKFQDVINEEGVRDPEVYNKLFNQIGETIFIKESAQ